MYLVTFHLCFIHVYSPCERVKVSICVLVSGRRACWQNRSVGRKAVGWAGSRSPSWGSGQRGWNLSLGRWGEESSQREGYCPGGGRVGRLFSASNNTAPGSHCHGVKGPNGEGVTGVRGYFWTVVSGWGGRGLASGWGEGTFIQLFSSSLLTTHPELASHSVHKPQWVHQVCVHQRLKRKVMWWYVICLYTNFLTQYEYLYMGGCSGLCVFHFPCPVVGVYECAGWIAKVDIYARAQSRVRTFHSSEVF